MVRITLLTGILFSSFAIESAEYIEYQLGLKSIKRDVTGQDLNYFDSRPYAQIGIYKENKAKALSYGTSFNIAPNLFGSDVGNQLHWKVLDLRKEMFLGHSLLLSAGALRHSKENPAWGYSLGFGYEFPAFNEKLTIHVNWARTNTDIGGKGADTGAKDNMVWVDIGLQF